MLARMLIGCLVGGLSACATYSGSSLLPGRDGLAEVLSTMGTPAMRWHEADGGQLLAYSRAPESPESFMVSIGPDGKLRGIRNVIVPENFELIKPGMSKSEVLRILGPAARTNYFAMRDELVLDWGYQVGADPAHFLVLFDATKETVRGWMIQVDRPPSMF